MTTRGNIDPSTQSANNFEHTFSDDDLTTSSLRCELSSTQPVVRPVIRSLSEVLETNKMGEQEVKKHKDNSDRLFQENSAPIGWGFVIK